MHHPARYRSLGWLRGLRWVVAVCVLPVCVEAAPFIRGDANRDGTHNIADVVSVLQYLFAGIPSSCEDALDVNDDGTLTISDGVKLARYLFGVTGGPAAPFPECGIDSTEDTLGCAAFSEETCPNQPPACLTRAALEQALGLAVGQPLCLPSPLYETQLFGSAVVLCPSACCTCAGGLSGCEAVFEAAAVAIDVVAGTLTIEYGGTAHIPTDIGATRCDATFAFVGALTVSGTFEPTAWPGIYEFTAVQDIVFSVDELTVDSPGGFVCLGLRLVGPLFQEFLAQTVNGLADQLFAAIPDQLEGAYICQE